MFNYIGVRCPVCNKKFVSADDIVVCPVCGAPHHRDCYAGQNACAFAADHLSGKEWRPPAPEPQPQAARPVPAACPRCSSPNPSDYLFCQVCGAVLGDPRRQEHSPFQQQWQNYGASVQVDPISLVYGGLSPDESIQDESVRDIALYVGESTAYYLPRFKALAEEHRMLTFNLPALFFNFLFFFHRKLYRIGAALLALYIISLVPQFFYMREILPEFLQYYGFTTTLVLDEAAAAHYLFVSQIAETINMVIGTILAFCANRFYFDKVMDDIKRIREQTGDDRKILEPALVQKGGTNRIAVFALIGLLLVVMFSVSVYLIFVKGGIIL